MSKKIIKSAFYGMVLSFLTWPVMVVAYEPPPGKEFTVSDIQKAIETIANFMIYIGVAVAVIFITWGGITYMTAGGDEEKIGTAKKRIIWGLVGAAIIVGVGAIIRTLQSILVRGGGGLF